MNETCSTSSILEISVDETNRSDQRVGGEDVEMAPANQGGLFLPKDDEDPQT